MHETFDHTADLGLRIKAATLNDLFEEAAQALVGCTIENPDAVEPREQREIVLEGEEKDFLLFDWLKAILYLLDAEDLVLVRFEVKVSETGLTATAWGEPLDRSRHELGREVKAITYHGLVVEETDLGWLAEVIVDI